ncbi:MAG: Na+/H+ antiporter NhaA [Gammaproteobacteria bacterium]|nr:Na+/H+ antiporter NhaA [Gammaproteobacteria bacterium]
MLFVKSIGNFFRLEAASGVVLLFAAVIALLMSNTSADVLYNALLTTPLEIRLGDLHLAKPLFLWINDGLMAIFFLTISLEIKHEFLEGHLAHWSQASLPLMGAIGGMLCPALIYVWFNQSDATAINGWAIPTATDIAFALAIVALLGARVPVALKTFLLLLAVIDDLGAIIIIAMFYTDNLSWLSLALAGACCGVLLILNFYKVTRIAAYIMVGVVLWVCVLKSGVHATLAGVILGFAIPLKDSEGNKIAGKLMHSLVPWVAFGIMPLFAFVNAGVDLKHVGLGELTSSIPLGIMLGLFLGKQFGIFIFSWAAIKLGISQLPKDANWLQLYGIALLCGIGFTMSLFIGSLAFSDPAHTAAVRLGVLVGSFAAGVLGYIVLRYFAQPSIDA